MALKRKNMMEFLNAQRQESTSIVDGLKRDLPIDQLIPREGQPRTHFDQEDLEVLASTIRELGIIQPIVVRPAEEKDTDRYEIVAGERRWRAARLAGLSVVPVIVRHLDGKTTALYSLAENIARRNLNPIEQAHGYNGIMEEHALSQTRLAEAIGQNVKTLNRVLRLLKLPPEIQELIASDHLTAKHGELLLSTPPAQQLKMASLAADKGWSIRELERQLTRVTQSQRKQKNAPNPNIERERTLWMEQLGADVTLNYRPSGKISITITVQSLDEYQGIRDRFLAPEE
ncbi:MAG: ParB/RepB/Spo0J family partition protein [Gammaproteobacteria bacterium]|nr:ParB/RepB/Spo0J family partition protein [Gammaproteobacteria bacterium]